MSNQDLKKIVDGLEKSIDEYNQMSLPAGLSKQEAINIISKEVSLISGVEKREHEMKVQDDEYQLKKDHQYFLEGQDKERLSIEKQKEAREKSSSEHEMKVKDQELEIRKQEQALRQSQFNAEQEELKIKHENERKEFWFKVSMFATTSLTTILGIVIPCMMYKSLAKTSMRYSWQYDGRTPSEFNEFMRGVKPRV